MPKPKKLDVTKGTMVNGEFSVMEDRFKEDAEEARRKGIKKRQKELKERNKITSPLIDKIIKAFEESIEIVGDILHAFTISRPKRMSAHDWRMIQGYVVTMALEETEEIFGFRIEFVHDECHDLNIHIDGKIVKVSVKSIATTDMFPRPWKNNKNKTKQTPIALTNNHGDSERRKDDSDAYIFVQSQSEKDDRKIEFGIMLTSEILKASLIKTSDQHKYSIDVDKLIFHKRCIKYLPAPLAKDSDDRDKFFEKSMRNTIGEALWYKGIRPEDVKSKKSDWVDGYKRKNKNDKNI